MPQCRACHAKTPAAARFCPGCGAALAKNASPVGYADERRVVTAVFCDLVESTALASTVDPELFRILMSRYYELMHQQISQHGGVIEKFIGDAVVALFGLKKSRHDDARQALRAALGMAAAGSQLAEAPGVGTSQSIALRIGVHTGEVVTGGLNQRAGALIAGDVVSIAARLQAAAAPGTVLVSTQTRAAAGQGVEVGPPAVLRLKGLPDAREAFPLLGIADPDAALNRRLDVPFAGRGRELATLDRVWQDALERAHPRVVLVGGEAGIGKSRLLAEWLAHEERRTPIVTARCGTGGGRASLTPLMQSVAKLVAEIEGDSLTAERAAGMSALGDAVRLLRSGLLLDGTPSPSVPETAIALAEVLFFVARKRVPVIVIDEFHHAQEPLRETIVHLVKRMAGGALLCLLAARTEQERETRAQAELLEASHIHVSSLSQDEAMAAAAAFAEVTAHTADLAPVLVERGGGNPLYLEQLAALLEQDPNSGFEIPLSLHGLLAERIDRLTEAERLVLRTASVIDMEFDRDTLDDLLRQAAGGGKPGALDTDKLLFSLARHRLVDALTPAGRYPARSYRFANAIIQRAAYDGLVKRRRADLHERLARSLCRIHATDALIGNHLMRAHRFRLDIGLADEHTSSLAQEAALRLAAAGREALQRVDLLRAEALFIDAIALMAPLDAAKVRCLQQQGEVQLLLGRHDEAFATLRLALDAAQRFCMPEVAAHARMHLHLEGSAPGARERTAKESIAVFAAVGDTLGLARSELVLAESALRRGRFVEAERLLRPAIRHAAVARADRELANTLGAWGLALWHGPMPADRAAAYCERLLRQHGSARLAVSATLGFSLTMLHVIRGDGRAAQRCMRAADEAMQTLGHADGRVFRPYLSALVRLGSAKPLGSEEAERVRAELEDARTAALDLRADSLAMTISLDLARLALERGDEMTACMAIEQSRADAGHPVLYAAQSGLRARITLMLAGQDALKVAEVEVLARNAMRAAFSTDSPTVRGQALRDVAAVFAATGRQRRAEVLHRRARALFAMKGHRHTGARFAVIARSKRTSLEMKTGER